MVVGHISFINYLVIQQSLGLNEKVPARTSFFSPLNGVLIFCHDVHFHSELDIMWLMN